MKPKVQKERRTAINMTVAPKTTRLLDEIVEELNIDGVYAISRGRIIDFLVEEASKKDGFFQIKIRDLAAR